MALPKPKRDENKNSILNTIDETTWITNDNEASKNTPRRTTSIILNEALWKALKLFCIEHDLKTNRFVEEAIYNHFVEFLRKQNISVSDQDKESWLSKTK